MTNFFDDYPCLEPLLTAKSARTSLEVFFQILGWKVSDGEKAADFGSGFEVLGVEVEFVKEGKMQAIKVVNKEKRKQDIVHTIDNFLTAGTASRKDCAKLAGKLQFAKGQVLGKGVDSCLSSLHGRVARPGLLKPFTCEDRLDLTEFKERIMIDPPRKIDIPGEARPLLLFTDGCSVQDVNMFGAVLIDSSSGKAQVAWGHIPEEMITFWGKCVGDQLITQIELYPLVVWRWIAGARWLDRRILCFIDNEPARFTMIRGTSPSLASRLLVKAFVKAERKAPAFCWFARVPSFSNVADAPSRGLAEQTARQLGAELVTLKPDRELLDMLSGKCR